MISYNDISSASSEKIELDIADYEIEQGQIAFNGGAVLNFCDLLTNVNDVKTKNFTLFYLTDKKVPNFKNTNITNISQTVLHTYIRFGDQYLTFTPTDVQSSDFNTEYLLTFSKTPKISTTFTITFMDEKFCTISYTDKFGEFYMILNASNTAVLKRKFHFDDLFIQSKEQFFQYIIVKDKIYLFKDTLTGPMMLIFKDVENTLFGSSSIAPDTIRSYGIEIAHTEVAFDRNNIGAGVTSYSDIGIFNDIVDLSTENNFLLGRNIYTKDKITSVLPLKNQYTDLDILSPGNNLAYQNKSISNLYDLREYTCIGNNIDACEAHDLEVNFVHNNTTLAIDPGDNIFTLGDISPFIQLSIHDATLKEQGAMNGRIPAYSDMIFQVESDNSRPVSLLCTWLSGGLQERSPIWIDRYYYPDKTTREEALKELLIYNKTFANEIIQKTTSNELLFSTINDVLYFDTKSTLAFKSNNTYIYRRVDWSGISFESINDLPTANPNDYYLKANTERGFLLSFNTNNYTTDNFFIFRSLKNNVDGYFEIGVNNTTAYVRGNLFDQSTQSTYPFAIQALIYNTTRNSITFYIDTYTGSAYLFVNGRKSGSFDFTPIKYENFLFGPFITNKNQTLFDFNAPFQEEILNTINNVFFRAGTLSLEQLEAFVLSREINHQSNYCITLPCSMRNKIEVIGNINTFTDNLISKSRNVTIDINGLNIADERVVESIKSSLISDLNTDFLLNAYINDIHINNKI